MDTPEFFLLSRDMLAVLDRNGAFQELNPSWQKHLQWDPEELRGQPCLNFVHPEDRELFENHLKGLISKEDADLQIRFRDRSGSYHILSWDLHFSGKTPTCMVFARDITAQKELEETLRREKQRLELSQEQARFGTWEYDLSTGRIFWSREVFRIHGVEHRTDPPGYEELLNLFAEESQEVLKRAVQAAIQEGQSYRLTLNLVTPKKERRVAIGLGLPIRDHNGKVCKLHGTLIDITEQRETQAKLIQASKMSSLGMMAGGLAHEINNPLSVIKLKAQQIRRSVMSGQPDVEMIQRNSTSIDQMIERISAIIRGLRVFARDGSKDRFQTVAIRTIIDDTLAFCTNRFMHHGVELRRPTQHLDTNIECQAVQISQVLLNLLNNAFDAVSELPQKWVEIEVMDLGTQVELAVKDSGSGIPKGIQPVIFQPFFTTKEVGKGTGLGLSISVGIIKAHQGSFELDIHSSHTRFVLRLPKQQITQQHAS